MEHHQQCTLPSGSLPQLPSFTFKLPSSVRTIDGAVYIACFNDQLVLIQSLASTRSTSDLVCETLGAVVDWMQQRRTACFLRLLVKPTVTVALALAVSH